MVCKLLNLSRKILEKQAMKSATTDCRDVNPCITINPPRSRSEAKWQAGPLPKLRPNTNIEDEE